MFPKRGYRSKRVRTVEPSPWPKTLPETTSPDPLFRRLFGIQLGLAVNESLWPRGLRTDAPVIKNLRCSVELPMPQTKSVVSHPFDAGTPDKARRFLHATFRKAGLDCPSGNGAATGIPVIKVPVRPFRPRCSRSSAPTRRLSRSGSSIGWRSSWLGTSEEAVKWGRGQQSHGAAPREAG